MNRDYLDDRCSAFTSKDANEIYDALIERSHGAYVDCYPEDLTDERVGMICRINQWLKARVVRS